MQRAQWFLAMALCSIVLACAFGVKVQAGQVEPHAGYRILSPLNSGNLTIFPVAARNEHDTSIFISLDEGLRSGDVVVGESGSVQPLIRRPGQVRHPNDGAQVNTLVLVNNSKKPLLLLAGEIVTGGKQDRVIGKDRIVPAMSDPVDLGVFCVEPGRWTGHTEKFGAIGGIAQPKVRANAMAKKDQQQVWDSVRASNAGAMETVEVIAASPTVDTATAQVSRNALTEMHGTTSYARVMENKAVQNEMDKIAKPIESRYRSLIKELRDRNAVGVVVAVNGQILWADIFASTALLEKYWPKLVRSYAAEAMTQGSRAGKVSESEAQAFVDRLDGTHETAETDPGIYRHAEITGADYKVFALTSLLPKTDYTVHLAKMYEPEVASKIDRMPPLVR
jgi:hypothetical protein